MAKERETVRISVDLMDAEFDRLKAESERFGLTKRDYVRICLRRCLGMDLPAGDMSDRTTEPPAPYDPAR